MRSEWMTVVMEGEITAVVNIKDKTGSPYLDTCFDIWDFFFLKRSATQWLLTRGNFETAYQCQQALISPTLTKLIILTYDQLHVPFLPAVKALPRNTKANAPLWRSTEGEVSFSCSSLITSTSVGSGMQHVQPWGTAELPINNLWETIRLSAELGRRKRATTVEKTNASKYICKWISFLVGGKASSMGLGGKLNQANDFFLLFANGRITYTPHFKRCE